jgi:hypothetical protein
LEDWASARRASGFNVGEAKVIAGTKPRHLEIAKPPDDDSPTH